MRFPICLLLLCGLMTGCEKDTSEIVVVEKKGLNRPIVAIVPIIDHSKNHLSWNLSEELSMSIRKRLVSSNQLYLPSQESFAAKSTKAVTQHDPFDIETGWVKKLFSPNEFVVFMELLEHKEIPQESAVTLNMKARIRVFDLRGEEPKLVLQEICEDSHHIPKDNRVVWGDETYDVTPLGIAHNLMSKQLAERVEDYILIASR